MNSNVRGHSPSNMSLSYNSVSEELSVSITHNVATPNSHYIWRIRIWVNASLVNTSQYNSQPTTSTFVYQYNIVAGNGATIQATADCIQGGSITRSITVGSTKGQTEQPTIPGFYGLIPILVVSGLTITFLIIITRKINLKESQ